MKKITYLLAVVFALAFSWQGTAQTFTGATGAVPDNACPTLTPYIATVTGVGVLGGTNVFDQIEMTINHTWGSDLEVSLTAPNGTQVALTIGNGGNGTQYVNTIFRADAGTSITTGSGDFTGTWLPEGNLSDFDGINADGDWTLDVCDSAGGDTGTVNLFEITFAPAPSCFTPSALTVSNITGTQADLSWTAGGTETAWNIEWGANPLTLGSGTPVTGVTNPYALTGLTADTSYDYYVQADCGLDGTSTWAGPFTFFTGYCASVPTSNDANGISNVQLGATDFPTGDVTYFDHTGTVVDIAQSTTANLQVTFATGYTYDTNVWIDYNDNLIFEASEQVFDGESTNTNPTTLDASFPVAAAAALGNHRMRMGTADTGQATPDPCYNGSFGVTLDFIVNVTAPPSCLAPTDLAVSNVGSTTATLNWTENNGASSWDLELVDITAGGSQSGTLYPATITNPFSFTGLTANNQYEVYVRTDCGPGQSTWTGPFAFSTLCAAIVAPYAYGFEDVGTIDSCWKQANTDDLDWTALTGATGSTGTGPTAAQEGAYYIYLETTGSANSNIAIIDSPLLDLTAMTTPRLNFYLHMYGAGMDPDGNVDVAVSTDLGATFTSVFNQVGNQGDVWNNIVVDLFAYQASNQVLIRFTGTTSSTGTTYENDFAIDNFVIEETPSCPAPNAMTASSITGTTASLDWTENGTASVWDLEIGISGFTATGTPTANDITKPYAAIGLITNTTYDVYYRADCGADNTDVSTWVGPFSFATSCPVSFTAPYSMSFEDAGAVNACWTNEAVTDDLDWTALSGATVSSATGPSAAQDGSYYLYVETSGSSQGDTAVLYSPSIDLSGLTTPSLSFYLHMYGAGMDPDGAVEVAVSNDAGATYTTAFNQIGNQGDVWNQIIVDLSALAGDTVIFRITGTVSPTTTGNTYENDFAIDNFVVDEAPTCFAPTNLVVTNISTGGANFSWDAATPVPVDGYYWEIQPQGSPQGDAAMIDSGTTASGVLTATTAATLVTGDSYTLYVNSVCIVGVDESSFASVDFSVPFSAGCGLYSNFPGVAIPDNDTTGITDTMAVSDGIPGEVITDLNVYVGATHTWSGDLTVTLTSPSGTSVIIFDSCGSEDNLDVEFDDAGVAIACGTGGVYIPDNPLSAFNGESWNGTWTLTVVDTGAGDTGTLDQWCLIPTFGPNPLCGGVTKTWDGTVWSPAGAPGLTDTAIIAGFYETGTHGNIDACTLRVDAGHFLIVDNGTYVNLVSNADIAGTLIIDNNASFVQTDAIAITTRFSGATIDVIKQTPIYTSTGFSIVGNPMTGGDRAGLYDADVSVSWVRSHNTANFVPNAGWPLDINNWADDNGNNWNEIAATDLIVPGAGYLVGGVAVNGNTITTTYNQGTLNSGDITFTPLMNTGQNDSPNVLSNPYASGLDITAFIAANGDAGPAVYFWEHLTAPSNAIPGYNGNMNYSMGDISNTNGVTANAAANGGAIPSGIMPSGQGFGIKPSVTTPITFTNAMRSNTNTGYRTVEKDELHLLIRNETYDLNGNAAIGFTSFTEDGLDSYDVTRLGTFLSLYTLDTNMSMQMGIQMRSVFTVDQVIPLGFSTLVEEEQTYTISIRELEGAMIEQANVYLKDNVLNTLTNLSETDYTFTSNAIDQQDRFAIVFADNQLGTGEASLAAVSVYPNPTKNLLNIVSPLSKVTNVVVYDIAGRTVAAYDFTNKANTTLDMTSFNSAVYFVEINTADGSIVKRVIRE